MISPHSFDWNGHSSTIFNVVSNLSFDSDNGDTTVISREAVVSETYNNVLKHGYNYKWSESMEVTVTLIKNDFGDFTFDENQKILSWLTSKQTPGFLTVYKDDNNVSYEVLGNWTSVSQYKLGNNRIVGYVCVFSSLMPYALSPIQEVEQPITTRQIFEINCHTPLVNGQPFNGLLYPKITVSHLGKDVGIDDDFAKDFVQYQRPPAEYLAGTSYVYNGNYYWVDNNNVMQTATSSPSSISTTSVAIENITEGINTLTTVQYSTPDETVIVDGANKVISSDRFSGRIFGDEFNWIWMPLKYGINTIRVTGNCTIKFEYRVPIMAGDMVG